MIGDTNSDDGVAVVTMTMTMTMMETMVVAIVMEV